MQDNQLVAVVQQSGLEQTHAQTILDSFTGFFEEAKKWEEKAKGLVVTDVTQTAIMGQAREARLALKEVRVNAEKARKEAEEKDRQERIKIENENKRLREEAKKREEEILKQRKLDEEKRKAEEAKRIEQERLEANKKKEQKKDELFSSMVDELEFLFEDVSDDGDGELQLTEEGKRVYDFITNLINE